jgi:hypothetical protein
MKPEDEASQPYKMSGYLFTNQYGVIPENLNQHHC